MPPTDAELETLARLAALVVPDDLDCDGCLPHMAEFLESGGAGLAAVAAHLSNCVCCREELAALTAAARAADGP